MRFKIEFDLGRGDEVQPLRTTIPRDDPYDTFLRRLSHIFCYDPSRGSQYQWEYILVDRSFEKGEPLPLNTSDAYYAMVNDLVRTNSPWRHAVVRQPVGNMQPKAVSDTDLMRLSILRILSREPMSRQPLIICLNRPYSVPEHLFPPPSITHRLLIPLSLISHLSTTHQ